MRGKLKFFDGDSRDNGITPACAGKTPILLIQYFSSKDHPRVCGENRVIILNLLTLIGSPPRVRGKPMLILIAISRSRITPACAGKTDNEKKILVVY